MNRAVARNAAFAGLRYLLAAILALWVTRYMLGALGGQRFGVWALAGALVPLFRLLDLGLNRAVTRAVATATGAGQPADAAAALGTGRALTLVIGAVTVVAVWLLSGALVRLLSVPADLVAPATFVLIGTAFVAAVEGVFSPYQAALDGTGRMDLSSSVDTVQRLASTLGVVLVLALGWGLAGLVFKNLVTAVVAGAAYRQLLVRQDRTLASAHLAVDRAEATALLSFGRHIQVVNLGALLIEPVSKAVLSRAVGLEAVTLYDLAMRVTGQLGGAFLALAAALFPAAAEARARAPDAADVALLDLYRPAARYLAWLALPAFGLLAVLAGPFVTAWLGPAYRPVAHSMSIQSVGWLVAVLSIPAFLIAQAGGHERVSTVSGSVTAGVSLALAVTLVQPYGLAGVVWAGALGLAAGGLVALALFARRFDLGWRGLGPASWRVWLATAAAMLAAWAGATVTPASFVGVMVAGSIGGAVYVIVLLASGELGVKERTWLRARLAERFGAAS